MDQPIKSKHVRRFSRTLARVEARLPANSGKAFIAPRDVWNACVQTSDVFSRAMSDIFVVDPYMDDSILGLHRVLGRRGILRLLKTTKVRRFAEISVPAAEKWTVTHASRPALVEIADNHSIAIDKQSVSVVIQSLKDLGATAPATVTRFVDDLTPEKLSVCEGIWSCPTVRV